MRSVVLGLGNLLNGDEGFGLAALQALQLDLGPQPELEFLDGLLATIEKRRKESLAVPARTVGVAR